MADGVYAGIGPAGERSWNPAWRPDNDRSTDASAPPPAASPSLPSQLDDRPITPPPGVQGGNENHPDLGNLREALNRSLSSPGGCEMEENPIHADHAEHDHLSTEDHAQPAPTKLTQVRSDFPAPRPSQDPPAPHGDPSTSASFARTISQGVSWGEDESTEPLPWDSRPAALDPRDFISDPHRTNSFPDVPELHQPADLVPSPEPSRSQAEPILKREEKNLESENRDWFGTQPGPEDDEWNQVLPSMPGGSAEGATTPFAPVNGSGGPEISDDQARYEEGLPLIAEGDARKTKQHEALPAKVNGITPAESYASDPHPLERKSTEQVLGGLYQSSSQENIESQASKSPSVNTTGGGIAVSRSTIISQVLSEKRLDALEIDSTPPESDAPAPGEDLAAMWKAALDDDDFLDEQEALDEPTNLFPGESAGFTPEVTNGPPGPMPVINQDGQIQGFSSLTVAGARTAISDSLQGRYTPQTVARPQSSSAYVPTMSLSSSLHSPPSLPGQQAVSYPWNAPSVRPLPNPETARAQSFADKSKGGYESPYDLPMDVSRPRKRASVQQLARGLEPRSVPLPMGMPPRSTSMYSSRSQDTYPLAPPSPQVGDMPSVASSLGPPASNPPREQSKSVGPGAMAPSLKAKPSSSNFFEDLPVTAKPRQSLATGRYATQPGAHASLPNPATGVMPLTFTDPTPRNVLPPGPPGFAGANLSTMEAEQLRAPERVSPYAPHPQSLHQLPPPSTTSRYSPAPPPQGGAQGPSRYAAPIMAQPHRPRTSSPLAYQQVSPKSSDPQPTYQAMHPAAQPVAHSYQPGPLDHQPAQLPSRATLPQSMGPNTSDYEPGPDSSTASAEPYAPRRSNAGLGASPLGPTVPLTSSPPKRVVSALSGLPPPAGPSSIPSTNTSPPRPQSHSPRGNPGPVQSASRPEPLLRSASLNYAASGPSIPIFPSTNSFTAGEGAGRPTHDLSYVAPTDGREADPLQRWRGCPIFSWGFGGSIITTFPNEVRRYSSGQAYPMVMCTPGEVKIKEARDVLPIEEYLTTFPGPLRAKGKKKEVLAWLEKHIEHLNLASATDASMTGDQLRVGEHVLLWKVLRALIESDGMLDGAPEIVAKMRQILAPELTDDGEDATVSYGVNHGGTNISSLRAEPVDSGELNRLRHALLRGDRERAVWQAVDKRLWAHAMLISSTLSRDVWKQVIQEFVRQEVQSVGEDTHSLAALYEVFAGNFEESVDELVPPSARAGFQMVSKTTDSGPTRDVLHGLDKWRETLGLVLSNRSPEDGQALLALGRLLMGYGRVEAAHICFLFARAHALFGGADDRQSSIALVGADHLRSPFDIAADLEPVVLSEVYEYALTLSAASPLVTTAPHLQAYKLHHAMVLAEYGYRAEAQAYCEAIFNSIKATTRPSSYYHSVLLTALDDLTKRLMQTPKGASSSWISKPTMGKISGSLVTKFNSFIAGDDSDAASNGSGREDGVDVGPFARVAGETPVISRSPSNAELYGLYGGGDPYAPPTGRESSPSDLTRTSRYAPGRAYAPQSSQDSTRRSFEAIQPASQPHGATSETGATGGYGPALSQFGGYLPNQIQPPSQQASPYTPPNPISQPYPPQGDWSSPAPASSMPDAVSYGGTYAPYEPPPYQPSLPADPSPPVLPYQPPSVPGSQGSAPLQTYDASNVYEAPNSYEPPSGHSYEPPTYQPYEDDAPNGDAPPDSVQETKKKSFMDDDEDEFGATTTNGSGKDRNKAAKDKEAEENFKRAAAADASKDQQGGDKKGWFGGWFGKKDPNAAPGPIKAKLGEENSFYYDPDLKKWINKKGGDSTASTPSTAPPPPKGPPSRAGGAGSNMPRPPPSTSSSPLPRPPLPGSSTAPATTTPTSTLAPPNPSATSMSHPPSQTGTPEPSLPAFSPASGPPLPSSAPPSRPATSMSNASSIDDLLGQPAARKGGTMKKAKKGRGYVDVMAK